MTLETHRRCNQCHVVKPIEDFPRQQTGHYRRYCTRCKSRKETARRKATAGKPKAARSTEIKHSTKEERKAMVIARMTREIWPRPARAA